MIFFANAEGAITQSINTPINQGSNGANEVVLICPFSATVITARYILPNGEITRPYIMVKYKLEDKGFYAYRTLLDGAVTRKSGTITAQFTLWNDDAQLTTVSTSFFVNKGVPNIPMYNGEDALLTEILANLSLLEQEITNNVIREYNLGNDNDIGEYQIEFDELGYKEAPAVYNNFTITYGDYAGKVGTLFVVAKVVDNERYQNEILYVGDEVYTRLITIGEEPEDGAWVRSVDQVLNIKSNRAISNKAVAERFKEVQEQLDRVDSEIPLVIDEVLDLPNNSIEITAGYRNSIDRESLNREPKEGETATGFCKTSDNAIFSFLARFDGGVNDDNFCPFTFTETLLIHQALDAALSPSSRNPVENRAIAEKFNEVEEAVEVVRDIAQGKNTGYVFDTKADMETALSDADFVAKLKAGVDLFIRDDEQPDYWWDGEKPIPVDAKTDLTDYYNKQEIDARRSVQNITHLDTIYANESELPLTAENGTCVVVGSDGVFSLWAYYTGVTGEPVGWRYKYPVRANTIYCVLKKNGQPYNKLLRFTMAPPYFLELSSTKVERIVKDGTPIAKIIVDGEETTIFGAANNSKTITLLSNKWSNNNQTVVFDGLTLTSFVFISPVGNPSAYAEAGIYCSAQGVGSLTFSCENTPSADIEVNVFVMG